MKLSSGESANFSSGLCMAYCSPLRGTVTGDSTPPRRYTVPFRCTASLEGHYSLASGRCLMVAHALRAHKALPCELEHEVTHALALLYDVLGLPHSGNIQHEEIDVAVDSGWSSSWQCRLRNSTLAYCFSRWRAAVVTFSKTL